MRTAVIDSSPLIYLVHLELAKSLSQFFDVIYVPRTVQAEVNKKGRFRYSLNKLYRTTAIFRRCVVADKFNVHLHAGPGGTGLNEGEAEAIVQAQERGAKALIVDEKLARKIGNRMGIKPVGTARILARLHLEGFADDPRRLIRKLRLDLECRITDSVVEEAVARAHEPI